MKCPGLRTSAAETAVIDLDADGCDTQLVSPITCCIEPVAKKQRARIICSSGVSDWFRCVRLLSAGPSIHDPISGEPV